jgi:hypothetical protein
MGSAISNTAFSFKPTGNPGMAAREQNKSSKVF